MTQTQYTFNVVMTCSGCSGAVERVLRKKDGVESYEVSLEMQTVMVQVDDDKLTQEDILQTIKKTGKKVTLAE